MIIGSFMLIVIAFVVISLPFGIWLVLIPEIISSGGVAAGLSLILPMLVTVIIRVVRTMRYGMETFIKTLCSLSIWATLITSAVIIGIATIRGELTDNAFFLPFVLYFFSIAPSFAGTMIIWLKEKIAKRSS